jgi:prophage antirepressor-like protein
MKTEIWNGYPIRFVEKDGEWWAVLKDVCDALGLKTYDVSRRIKDMVSTHNLETAGGKQQMLIVNEFGIYDTVFQSRKSEAKEFRYWVYEMLKQLRQATGLEGFQIFRMLDKEHQKEAMRHLQQSLRNPVRVDFIKANTIANKAISNRYGYPKMVKKADMTPQMLVEREPILEDTVELMGVNDKYDLGISVSEQIYKKCV